MVGIVVNVYENRLSLAITIEGDSIRGEEYQIREEEEEEGIEQKIEMEKRRT